MINRDDLKSFLGAHASNYLAFNKRSLTKWALAAALNDRDIATTQRTKMQIRIEERVVNRLADRFEQLIERDPEAKKQIVGLIDLLLDEYDAALGDLTELAAETAYRFADELAEPERSR